MTNLNGIPRDQESFIQGICSRRRLTKLQQSWEGCVQEEERTTTIEEKLNENEDQALEVHTKGKNKRKSYDHTPRKLKGLRSPRKTSQIMNASLVT